MTSSGQSTAANASRIRDAIEKAAQASGEFDLMEAQRLTERVTHFLEQQPEAATGLDVEQIQDFVELVLLGSGYFKTACRYSV